MGMEDVHKEMQRFGVAFAEQGNWCIGSGQVEHMHNVGDAGKDVVSGAGGWHADMGGEPSDRVTDASGACGCYPDCVAAVGVPGRSKVPALQPMGGPTAASIWFDMGQDAGARWRNGCAVEVECAMEVCPGRELGVALAAA